MNYRHAFHAGNFADVLKHVVLARILAYLIQKPAPLRYIDTHAGLGWYDLAGVEAGRTGEWRDGIGLLDDAAAPPDIQALLEPYLRAVGPRDAAGMPFAYPGSPAVAQDILRSTDRLLLAELHPADGAVLRAATKADKRIKVLAQDGYQVLIAAVPPPERRGLVLIDPPFEDKAEADRMAGAFEAAYRKWPTGTYALWYPIKNPATVASLLGRLRALALPRTLEIELFHDGGEAETGLRGSGLFIVNPPYTLAGEAAAVVPFLAARFAHPARHWAWRLDGTQG